MSKFSEVNLHNLHNVDKLFREASKWFYFDKFKMLLHHNKVIIKESWLGDVFGLIFKHLKGLSTIFRVTPHLKRGMLNSQPSTL